MIYTTDKIVDMVRVAIDRNQKSKPLIRCRDPDILPLDHIILSKISMAAQYVYRKAPVALLAETAVDIANDTIYWHSKVDGMYSGHVPLPADYLRLVAFEMSDWRHPVYKAIDIDSPYYEAASHRYSGGRGTPSRPACLISDTALGPRLEFHSCYSDDAQIAQAKYIPRPHIDIDTGINLDPRSRDLVVETTAVMTLACIGEISRQEMHQEIRQTLDSMT